MRTNATIPEMSATESLKNTDMGNVSVFIGVAPANMTLAPNSPTARLQLSTAAAMIPFDESGSRTLLTDCHVVHPNVIARPSYIGSIESNVALIVLVAIGMITQNWATTNPGTSNTIPKTAFKTSPREVDEKKMRSTAPKATGGSINGIEKIASITLLPRGL
jgi:hypothetical protein